jgi:6-phosphofructokinase
VILIPEEPFDIVQVARHLKRRARIGRTFSIVVVAEGSQPVKGRCRSPSTTGTSTGGPGWMESASASPRRSSSAPGIETRVTILGRVQRGGTPTAFDRVLATQLGIAAIGLASEGRWGMMAALQGAEVAAAPISEATGRLNTVPDSLYQVAEVFFA